MLTGWRCFLCEPAALVPPVGSPPEWVPVTHVCGRHGVPRLGSGRPLLEVFAARDVLRNDDWYSMWLFNPVQVEGHRAWFSIAAGMTFLMGEAFPSNDSFEYFSQHLEDSAVELLALHQHQALFASVVDLAAMARYLEHRSQGHAFNRRTFDALVENWTRRRSFAAFRERVDPHRTRPEEELLDLAHDSQDLRSSPSGADYLNAVADLLTLARRRFPA